jgi:hypothetical protein
MWIRKSIMLSALVMTTGMYGFGSSDLKGFDQAIRETKVSMTELLEDRNEGMLHEAHNELVYDELMYRLYSIYTALLNRNKKSPNTSR